jgi:hypothetical protein
MPFRKVRACRRKQRKAPGCSATTPIKPWSGAPPLNLPVLLNDETTLCYPPAIDGTVHFLSNSARPSWRAGGRARTREGAQVRAFASSVGGYCGRFGFKGHTAVLLAKVGHLDRHPIFGPFFLNMNAIASITTNTATPAPMAMYINVSSVMAGGGPCVVIVAA